MSDDYVTPIYVAILGTDAVLAARPVEPVQLTRACMTAGFGFVAPVSWGEELIACHLADRMSDAGRVAPALVASSCPLVSDQLRRSQARTPVVETVPPPVASARYLRAAFHPRTLHVTYVGACPGAAHPEIDTHCLPDVLFTRLVEAGIDASSQPRHLDEQIPVERARYASTPGGAPASDWLMARTGTRVIEAAPITVDAVAQTHGDDGVLIDLAVACRCTCARDRAAAARLEPARSSRPVVVTTAVPVAVSLESDDAGPQPMLAEPAAEEGNLRATFAENGLSGGEAAPLAPVAHRFTTTREPW